MNTGHEAVRPESKHVVLVRVPEDLYAGLQEIVVPYESLGLGCVAADLRARGHRVTILDGTLVDLTEGVQLSAPFAEVMGRLVSDEVSRSPVDDLPPGRAAWLLRQVWLTEQIVNERPDLVGFSLISSLVYERVRELSALLRSAGVEVPFCAGGEQASLYATDVLTRVPGLDFCVAVEGEATLAEVLPHLDDREQWARVAGLVWRRGSTIVTNPRRPLVTNLDGLAVSARDTLPAVLARGGDALMYGSRGCVYNCSFCSIIEFYSAPPAEKWRQRSVDAIVNEMEDLYRVNGADRFWFVDDIFFGSGDPGRRRGEELLRRLEEARLPVRIDAFCRANDLVDFASRGQYTLELDQARRRGLRRLFIGIESGSTAVLQKHFRKGVKAETNVAAVDRAERAGIDVVVEFIMFDPWTTLADVDANLKFLKTVARGPGSERGKYDPQVLSSRLYIHRETPLGRDFLAGNPELIAGPAGAMDYYVPYRFASPAAGALCLMVEQPWVRFAPAFTALEHLYRVVDRFWLPEWSDGNDAVDRRARYQLHRGRFDEIQRVLNDEALAFFEEALALVRPFGVSGDGETPEWPAALADLVDGYVRTAAVEVENVATAVYSLAVDALKDAWDEAVATGVLGPRTHVPRILVTELGYAPRLS